MSKYFKDSEFQRCDPSCSIEDMNVNTLARLDTAREIAGIPFVLNCAYRSPAHDRAKGRSGTGAHTLGRAVDIRCNADANRFKIVDALLKAGFKRIGVAKTFIHADDSTTHAQNVMWMY